MTTSNKVLFKCKVGSHAFGLNGPESDEDFATIYKCDTKDILGLEYKEHDDVTKDDRRYEVGKFIRLLMNGNPNMLEILNTPLDCWIEQSTEWCILRQYRQHFVTKKLYNTFINYAHTQIAKAKGLNKKANWEKDRIERKGVLDFCYVVPFREYHSAAISLQDWLKREELPQEQCGLVAIDHFRYTYWLYHDELAWVKETNHRYADVETYHFKGIVQDLEKSNDISLSSVPEYCIPKAIMYFNKDGYSVHCKDYASYQKWLEERNETRYNTNKKHGQLYDSKNVMHLVRLLISARKIAQEGNVEVRVNKDIRDHLLSIKAGEKDLKTLVEWADEEKGRLRELFEKSSLPEDVDKDFCNELLVKIRTHGDKRSETT